MLVFAGESLFPPLQLNPLAGRCLALFSQTLLSVGTVSPSLLYIADLDCFHVGKDLS